MSQKLQKLLRRRELLQERVQTAENMQLALDHGIDAALMVGKTPLPIDRSLARHMLLADIADSQEELDKANRQLSAAEAAVDGLLSVRTTQRAFHSLQGHVADGQEVQMNNGDVVTIRAVMAGWQLYVNGQPHSIPTNSAHVVERLIFSYPSEEI